MIKRQWWQRPELITAEHGERKVSWLELFFDLVFVVVIAQLAHALADNITPLGVLSYILLFVPVWWVWIGMVYYNSRFETHDVSYRLSVLIQMMPVAAMAIFIKYGVGERSVGFALSYAAARLLLILTWFRGGWHAPIIRPVTNRYVIGFTMSLVLWVSSIFVPPPWRYVMWGVGLAIDLLTPLTTLHIQAKLPRLSNQKLPERFGLFMIIVLGEAIVGVVGGMADREPLTLEAYIDGALAMVLVFGLWWVYFDFIARREPRHGVWWLLSWGYLHMPLAMSIAAISAGVQNVLALEGDAFGIGARWLTAGALAVSLVTMGIIELLLEATPNEPTDHRVSVSLKIAGGVLALLIAAVGAGLSAATLLLLLGVPVLIQIVYGAYAWYSQPMGEMVEMAE